MPTTRGSITFTGKQGGVRLDTPFTCPEECDVQGAALLDWEAVNALPGGTSTTCAEVAPGGVVFSLRNACPHQAYAASETVPAEDLSALLETLQAEADASEDS